MQGSPRVHPRDVLRVLARLCESQVRQRPHEVVAIRGRSLNARADVDEIAWVDLAIEAVAAIHELKIGSQRTNVRLQVLATVSPTAATPCTRGDPPGPLTRSRR